MQDPLIVGKNQIWIQTTGSFLAVVSLKMWFGQEGYVKECGISPQPIKKEY